MRTVLASLVLLALLSPAALADDSADIKAQIDAFSAAWSKHDLDALVATMTPDATLINPAGVKATGSEEIKKLIGHEHESIFKGTSYTVSNVALQTVTADVVLADVTASVTGLTKPDGSAAPDFAHRVAWVFVKKDGKWLGAAARPYKVLDKGGMK